jgi:pyridoxine 5'-phosphate synthase PdxJ
MLRKTMLDIRERRVKEIPHSDVSIIMAEIGELINMEQFLSEAIEALEGNKQPRGLRGTVLLALKEAKEFVKGEIVGKTPEDTAKLYGEIEHLISLGQPVAAHMVVELVQDAVKDYEALMGHSIEQGK